MGPPANCGTHRVNCRNVISSTIISQNFMLELFVKFIFFHVFRFRVDNARVFQRISINLNMTVGQAACRLLRRYTQCTLAASFSLRMNQAKGLVTACVWNATIQSLKVALQILVVCTTPYTCAGLAALSYNKNIVASKQFCSFVSVSIT